MDPFTITASVLRITGSCFGAAHTLWEIRQAWKRAPVTVSTLGSQLKLTAASLSQIQSLLLGDTDVLRDKPDLVATFDTTLTSCMVLSTLLEGFVQSIKKGALEGTKATWKMKFKTLWNEGEVKELLQQLSTQQDAISVLVNLLQIDSISEIKRLVRRHDRLLRQIAVNTRNIRKSHAVDAPESILGTDEASQSMFSQLIDNTDEAEPEFEKALLGSKLYTKAFTGILESTSDGDSQSVDTRTLVNSGASDHAPADCLRELRRIVHVLKIDFAYFEHRNISVMTTSSAFFGMERFPNHRYQGAKYRGKSRMGSLEEFDRSRIIVALFLTDPIKVSRTRVLEFKSPKNTVNREVSETFTIKNVSLDPDWITEEGPTIHISDLTVEESEERDIDRVLEYFSCPIPKLARLPRDQQRRRMRELIRGEVEYNKLALIAHCSTFKDLQYVANLMRK